MYFDKKNCKIKLEEWSKLLNDIKYKRVEKTILKNGKVVSTVWIGVEHQIFETMVFSSDDDFTEEYTSRYLTLKEAKAGHKEVVKRFDEQEKQELIDEKIKEDTKELT